jgi:hypothetical protein
MAASASGSSGTPGNYRPYRESADPANRELLDRVLEQTLARINEGQLFEEPDMNALKEVARRHRGQPFSLEPVALELVKAALKPQLGALADTPGMCDKLSLQVARMLLDDPVASGRLQSFWDRLSQVP